MLVLTRKKGQSIKIGDNIVITILDTKTEGIKIGVDAPRNVTIVRSELVEEVKQANIEATSFNKQNAKKLAIFLKKV